jgi:prophage antirepressor-like protein
MLNLSIYAFQYEGKELNAIIERKKPMFMLSEVCAILGIKDASEMLKDLEEHEVDEFFGYINDYEHTKIIILSPSGVEKLAKWSPLSPEERSNFETWFKDKVHYLTFKIWWTIEMNKGGLGMLGTTNEETGEERVIMNVRTPDLTKPFYSETQTDDKNGNSKKPYVSFDFEDKKLTALITRMKPVFWIKEICDFLEIEDYRKALDTLEIIDADVLIEFDENENCVPFDIVTEMAVMKLIDQSPLPLEKKAMIKDWFFQEVIPAADSAFQQQLGPLYKEVKSTTGIRSWQPTST